MKDNLIFINQNMTDKKTTKENTNQPKELTPAQKQKLEEWEQKLKSGKAVEETKKIIPQIAKFPFDLDYNLSKIAEDILPKILFRDEKLTEQETNKLDKIVYSMGFENGISIIDVVEERYRGMMIELKNNIIKEYNCKTYSEIALVDLAINAYSRNLTLSRYLINTNAMGHTTALLNNYLSVISKEIDRANRHFITALETLRQFKQPELTVNVRTKNAFIAQNQNLINSQNIQDKPNETIEPK